MHDVYMINSGKWIFIKFNPDSNYDDTDIEDKLNKLHEIMKESIRKIENEENIENYIVKWSKKLK